MKRVDRVDIEKQQQEDEEVYELSSDSSDEELDINEDLLKDDTKVQQELEKETIREKVKRRREELKSMEFKKKRKKENQTTIVVKDLRNHPFFPSFGGERVFLTTTPFRLTATEKQNHETPPTIGPVSIHNEIYKYSYFGNTVLVYLQYKSASISLTCLVPHYIAGLESNFKIYLNYGDEGKIQRVWKLTSNFEYGLRQGKNITVEKLNGQIVGQMSCEFENDVIKDKVVDMIKYSDTNPGSVFYAYIGKIKERQNDRFCFRLEDYCYNDESGTLYTPNYLTFGDFKNGETKGIFFQVDLAEDNFLKILVGSCDKRGNKDVGNIVFFFNKDGMQYCSCCPAKWKDNSIQKIFPFPNVVYPDSFIKKYGAEKFNAKKRGNFVNNIFSFWKVDSREKDKKLNSIFLKIFEENKQKILSDLNEKIFKGKKKLFEKEDSLEETEALITITQKQRLLVLVPRRMVEFFTVCKKLNKQQQKLIKGCFSPMKTIEEVIKMENELSNIISKLNILKKKKSKKPMDKISYLENAKRELQSKLLGTSKEFPKAIKEVKKWTDKEKKKLVKRIKKVSKDRDKAHEEINKKTKLIHETERLKSIRRKIESLNLPEKKEIVDEIFSMRDDKTGDDDLMRNEIETIAKGIEKKVLLRVYADIEGELSEKIVKEQLNIFREYDKEIEVRNKILDLCEWIHPRCEEIHVAREKEKCFSSDLLKRISKIEIIKKEIEDEHEKLVTGLKEKMELDSKHISILSATVSDLNLGMKIHLEKIIYFKALQDNLRNDIKDYEMEVEKLRKKIESSLRNKNPKKDDKESNKQQIEALNKFITTLREEMEKHAVVIDVKEREIENSKFSLQKVKNNLESRIKKRSESEKKIHIEKEKILDQKLNFLYKKRKNVMEKYKRIKEKLNLQKEQIKNFSNFEKPSSSQSNFTESSSNKSELENMKIGIILWKNLVVELVLSKFLENFYNIFTIFTPIKIFDSILKNNKKLQSLLYMELRRYKDFLSFKNADFLLSQFVEHCQETLFNLLKNNKKILIKEKDKKMIYNLVESEVIEKIRRFYFDLVKTEFKKLNSEIRNNIKKMEINNVGKRREMILNKFKFLQKMEIEKLKNRFFSNTKENKDELQIENRFEMNEIKELLNRIIKINEMILEIVKKEENNMTDLSNFNKTTSEQKKEGEISTEEVKIDKTKTINQFELFLEKERSLQDSYSMIFSKKVTILSKFVSVIGESYSKFIFNIDNEISNFNESEEKEYKSVFLEFKRNMEFLSILLEKELIDKLMGMKVEDSNKMLIKKTLNFSSSLTILEELFKLFKLKNLISICVKRGLISNQKNRMWKSYETNINLLTELYSESLNFYSENSLNNFRNRKMGEDSVSQQIMDIDKTLLEDEKEEIGGKILKNFEILKNNMGFFDLIVSSMTWFCKFLYHDYQHFVFCLLKEEQDPKSAKKTKINYKSSFFLQEKSRKSLYNSIRNDLKILYFYFLNTYVSVEKITPINQIESTLNLHKKIEYLYLMMEKNTDNEDGNTNEKVDLDFYNKYLTFIKLIMGDNTMMDNFTSNLDTKFKLYLNLFNNKKEEGTEDESTEKDDDDDEKVFLSPNLVKINQKLKNFSISIVCLILQFDFFTKNIKMFGKSKRNEYNEGEILILLDQLQKRLVIIKRMFVGYNRKEQKEIILFILKNTIKFLENAKILNGQGIEKTINNICVFEKKVIRKQFFRTFQKQIELIIEEKEKIVKEEIAEKKEEKEDKKLIQFLKMGLNWNEHSNYDVLNLKEQIQSFNLIIDILEKRKLLMNSFNSFKKLSKFKDPNLYLSHFTFSKQRKIIIKNMLKTSQILLNCFGNEKTDPQDTRFNLTELMRIVGVKKNYIVEKGYEFPFERSCKVLRLLLTLHLKDTNIYVINERQKEDREFVKAIKLCIREFFQSVKNEMENLREKEEEKSDEKEEEMGENEKFDEEEEIKRIIYYLFLKLTEKEEICFYSVLYFIENFVQKERDVSVDEFVKIIKSFIAFVKSN